MNRRELFAALAAVITGVRPAALKGAPIESQLSMRNKSLDAVVYGRSTANLFQGIAASGPRSLAPPPLTPREKAYGLPHSTGGLKVGVSAIDRPMFVAVGPTEFAVEILRAWHVETIEDGSRLVYLADGGFHVYGPNAYMSILPDELAA